MKDFFFTEYSRTNVEKNGIKNCLSSKFLSKQEVKESVNSKIRTTNSISRNEKKNG